MQNETSNTQKNLKNIDNSNEKYKKVNIIIQEENTQSTVLTNNNNNGRNMNFRNSSNIHDCQLNLNNSNTFFHKSSILSDENQKMISKKYTCLMQNLTSSNSDLDHRVDITKKFCKVNNSKSNNTSKIKQKKKLSYSTCDCRDQIKEEEEKQQQQQIEQIQNSEDDDDDDWDESIQQTIEFTIQNKSCSDNKINIENYGSVEMKHTQSLNSDDLVASKGVKSMYKLGQGSQGQVLKVYDLKQQKRFAMKCIFDKEKYEYEKQFYLSIQKEIGPCFNLYALQLHRYEDDQLQLYYQIGICSLKEYQKYIETQNIKFQNYELLNILQFLVNFVIKFSQINEQGIYHSDIKPDNIVIIHSEGIMKIKMVDFGVASKKYKEINGFTVPYFHSSNRQYKTIGSSTVPIIQTKIERINIELYQVGRTVLNLILEQTEFLGNYLDKSIQREFKYDKNKQIFKNVEIDFSELLIKYYEQTQDKIGQEQQLLIMFIDKLLKEEFQNLEEILEFQKEIADSNDYFDEGLKSFCQNCIKLENDKIYEQINELSEDELIEELIFCEQNYLYDQRGILIAGMIAQKMGFQRMLENKNINNKCLQIIALLLKGDDKLDLALEILQAILVRIQNVSQQGQLDIEDIFFEIADIYDQQLKYNQCLEMTNQCLDILNHSHEPDYNKIANVTFVLGKRSHKVEKYEDALDYYQESIQIKEKHYPDTCLEFVVMVKLQIGILKMNWGQYTEAMDILQKNLQQKLSIYGNQHLSYIDTLLYINQIYIKKKNFEKVQQNFDYIWKVLQEKENQGGTYLTFILYSQQGDYYYSLKDYDQTLLFYELAQKQLDIKKTYQSKYAKILYRLGNLYNKKKEYQQAYEYYEQSLELQQKIMQEDNTIIGMIYYKLGKTLTKMVNVENDYDAIIFMEKGYKNLQNAVGCDNFWVYSKQYNIGIQHFKEENFQLSQYYLNLAKKNIELNIIDKNKKLSNKLEQQYEQILEKLAFLNSQQDVSIFVDF